MGGFLIYTFAHACADERFTVNVSAYSQMHASFTIILEAFERADEEE